ncbi:MAG: hypothetical protein H7123_09715 [Thermoleophilia bacterium]|nr:hypothetical protein [Thermoleophilia bacterium]
MMLDPHNAPRNIDVLLEVTPLIQHSFVTAWVDGSLSRDDVRTFAPQLFVHLDRWPRYISTAHAITGDAEIRRVLSTALEFVEPAGASAADLWLQTCSALGLFSDSVRRAELTDATDHCVNDCFYLCGHTTLSAVTALYVVACQVRDLCRETRSGLAQYGLASGPGATFFDVIGYSAEMQAKRLRTTLESLIPLEDTAAIAEAQEAARTAAAAFITICDEAATTASL